VTRTCATESIQSLERAASLRPILLPELAQAESKLLTAVAVSAEAHTAWDDAQRDVDALRAALAALEGSR